MSQTMLFQPDKLQRGGRRGAAAILMLTMLSVFVVCAAVTINYAHMQLVRSELRIATDAAAKAGAEALSRTENRNTARQAAISYAQLNQVAGAGLSLTNSDVVLGRVVPGVGGKWQFSPNVQPFNSVQVKAKRTTPLFFGNTLGVTSFDPQETAVAGYQEYDVVLCLDRSGSMLFDMSGVDFVYPPNNPNLSNFTAWGTVWQNHLSPPHPTNSRWAVLARAVNDFLTQAGESTPSPYVGLVTWASDYTMPINPFTQYHASTLNVSLPTTSNYQAQKTNVLNNVGQLGNRPMMGGTNLAAGLDQAVNYLKSNSARSLSNKVVILLTDGEWNAGRDPILSANDAAAAGITVHTVSMLTNTQQVLTNIASITGGRSFNTANEAELRAAFKELAAGLRVVLVE